jgi:hypothetical protein
MPSAKTPELDTPVPDEFVPDPVVWKEFHVTAMTGHRWTEDPALDSRRKSKSAIAISGHAPR